MPELDAPAPVQCSDFVGHNHFTKLSFLQLRNHASNMAETLTLMGMPATSAQATIKPPKSGVPSNEIKKKYTRRTVVRIPAMKAGAATRTADRKWPSIAGIRAPNARSAERITAHAVRVHRPRGGSILATKMLISQLNNTQYG